MMYRNIKIRIETIRKMRRLACRSDPRRISSTTLLNLFFQSTWIAMEIFVYTGGNQKVPVDVEHVRIASSCKKIEDKVFIGRNRLKTLECEDGVEEIGESAFEDCESLTAFHAPSTLLKIGNRAFANCIKLRWLKLNEGLEEIGREAFLKCRCKNIPL